MQRLKEDSNALDRRRKNISKNRKNIPKMYTYGRELCFVFAILFTSYAALQNAPPKVSKSPPAVPFFGPNSIIADSYRGDLSAPFERFSESEASFVMYYAPWDAECQEMRSPLRAVAQYFYKQVHFAAINCWQPQSECKLQFSNIQQYPVIILYIQHAKGIQYKGIKDANNLIRFISAALNPLHRIHSWDDLFNLLANYDAVIVGFFDLTERNNSSRYQLFYNTALKFLEKDPHNEVAFGVVTNPRVAETLGIYKIPAIQLYLWNESVSYHGEAKEETICQWITQNIHQVAVWVSPPGVKSLTLSPYVEDGPTLIMFTPRNPFVMNLNYDLLKEVGLEYYNCNNQSWVNKLIEYVIKNREEKKEKFLKDVQMCQASAKGGKTKTTDSGHLTPISLPPTDSSRWSNVSYSDICQACNEICKRRQKQQQEEKDMFPSNDKDSSSMEECKKAQKASQHSMTSSDDKPDKQSPQQIILMSHLRRCRELRKALQISSNAAAKILIGPNRRREPSPLPTESFNGFACQTNQSLALLALDSLKFHQFAEGLGIDVLARPDQTSLVIFNAQDESAFVLDAPLNKASLQSFIVNYTRGSLPRSAPRRTKLNAFLNNYQTHSTYSECNLESEFACVPELDAATFLDALTSQKKALVVYFHSDHCAFCHGVAAHAFLMLARYFRHANDFIQFARLDGEAHDLPWQYTMDRYPALVYFPGDKREHESRLFPRDRAFTLPNLISFILSNLAAPEERCLAVISSLCASWFEAESQQVQVSGGERCLASAQRAYLHRISFILSRWRRHSTKNDKRHLLLTLQHLRECYFLLERGNASLLTFQRIRISFKDYARATRALKHIDTPSNQNAPPAFHI